MLEIGATTSVRALVATTTTANRRERRQLVLLDVDAGLPRPSERIAAETLSAHRGDVVDYLNRPTATPDLARMRRPRVYVSEARCKAAVARYVRTAAEMLDHTEGFRKRMEARQIVAEFILIEWGHEVGQLLGTAASMNGVPSGLCPLARISEPSGRETPPAGTAA
jgi:hypothetical protein